MTTTRAQALSYLQNEHANLLKASGVATTDTAGGLGGPLDKAFRALGTVEASLATATVTDAQTPALLALADYYTLSRIWRAVGNRADVGDGRQVLGARSQVFQQVKDLLAEAAATCASYGYPVGAAAAAAGAWTYGSINLDFIEPEADLG